MWFIIAFKENLVLKATYKISWKYINSNSIKNKKNETIAATLYNYIKFRKIESSFTSFMETLDTPYIFLFSFLFDLVFLYFFHRTENCSWPTLFPISGVWIYFMILRFCFCFVMFYIARISVNLQNKSHQNFKKMRIQKNLWKLNFKI